MKIHSVVKITHLQRAAAISPSTLNAEDRTVDVVAATENPVRMYDYSRGEFFLEILSMEPGAVNLERLNAGAPVFDNHNKYDGVKGTRGAVVKGTAEIINKELVTKLRFARDQESEDAFTKVREEIVSGISIGYTVQEYKDVTPETERAKKEYTRTLMATKWTPYEVSLAPVQADVKSKVRGENTEETYEVPIINERSITNNNNNNMTPEELAEKQINEAAQAEQQRKIAEAQAEAKKQGAKEALERKQALENIAALNHTDEAQKREFVDKYLTGDQAEVALDKVRSAEMDKWAAASKAPAAVPAAQVTRDAHEKTLDKMEAALFLRANPNSKEELRRDLLATGRTEADTNAILASVNEYRGMSLLDMAKETLENKGVKVRGMSPREVAEVALGLNRSGGQMSSSDFPLITQSTINRRLRMAYQYAPRTFMPFCRQSSARDFRPKSAVALTGLNKAFDAIPESGEYTYNNLTESGETYKLAKYGSIINFTWESIINDDLDAFSRLPVMIADKAAQKQSDIVWGIILTNPNMADGNALFSSAHGNLAGAGTAITVAGLSTGRAAMTKQQKNGDYLNINPEFLLVGPDKYTEAQQLIQATIMATKAQDTNVFKGAMSIIMEPRLTGNQWYLSASPQRIDTVEYSFLEGEEEIFTQQRVGFDVDGMEIKCRMVFAAKAIEWAGLYKNPGA